MHQDNDPKHTANTTKDFIMEKNWKVASQSPHHNPIEHAFHLLKRRLNGKKLPKQTTPAIGCSKSMEKHHKTRMQQFGDINGLQA